LGTNLLRRLWRVQQLTTECRRDCYVQLRYRSSSCASWRTKTLVCLGCGGCEGFNNLQRSVAAIAMSNYGMDLLPVRVEEWRHWFVLAAAAMKGSATNNPKFQFHSFKSRWNICSVIAMSCLLSMSAPHHSCKEVVVHVWLWTYHYSLYNHLLIVVDCFFTLIWDNS